MEIGMFLVFVCNHHFHFQVPNDIIFWKSSRQVILLLDWHYLITINNLMKQGRSLKQFLITIVRIKTALKSFLKIKLFLFQSILHVFFLNIILTFKPTSFSQDYIFAFFDDEITYWPFEGQRHLLSLQVILLTIVKMLWKRMQWQSRTWRVI